MSENIFKKKILNSPEEKQVILDQINCKFSLIAENIADHLADVEFLLFQYWKVDDLANSFSKTVSKNHDLMISYVETLD